MINRLTSSIDESLVNLTLLAQDAEVEQERTLYELQQVFLQFRKVIEKYHQRYEYDIKSSYAKYDQHLYELQSRLKQVRQRIIDNFTSVKNNDYDDYSFDINKYRYLEMLTTQTLNQTMDDQKQLPKYRIKLTNVQQLEEILVIQRESNLSAMNNNSSPNEITPTRRSISMGKHHDN